MHNTCKKYQKKKKKKAKLFTCKHKFTMYQRNVFYIFTLEMFIVLLLCYAMLASRYIYICLPT